MLDEPAKKRRKRDHHDDDHSSSSSADELLNEKPNDQENSKVSSNQNSQPKDENPTEEVFAFHLFQPTSKSTIPTQTSTQPSTDAAAAPQPQPALISIRSPSPIDTTAVEHLRLAKPRPDSHYFTASLPPHKLTSLRQSYADAALSPANIQSLASRPWPGSSHPWRLIRLPTHPKQIVVHRVRSDSKLADSAPKATNQDLDTAPATLKRRTRPNKKRREMVRNRAVARKRVVDETKTKEEHEREKKNKKNRERKLKRRAKERKEKEEKRAGAGLDDGDTVATASEAG